ncbi:MAG TPA: pyridoxal phosphate-dependent aminotransferase [Candidatus Nanopelagicales bacterium]|nr:pyridoxal phosphate-dependent aminotransferase [Candidatus Nanopelagicales bacterium]
MTRRQPPLVPRMREHATTVFGEMSALAVATGSVNLGQGFPDTDGPQVVKDAAIRAIEEGRGNQYPPAHGLPELRQAIAAHQRRFYGIDLDWTTDICVATGASEAIAAALLALVDDGDEVVMFSPWFDLYAAAVSLAGGTRVEVPLTAGTFRPDAEALRAAITSRTRLLLLNSPHNPTGSVFTRDELAAIAALVEEHDLWVISDEAYEHLVFSGSEHVPFSTLPGMAERTVTIGSAGKSLSLTGWKVGWATGPTDLVAAVRVPRQHLSYVSGGPFQWAVVEGLALPDPYWSEFRDGLERQRDLLCDGLAALGFPTTVPQGTYFATTDVRPLGYADGWAFCRDLPQRAGVVAIPHEVFHDDPEAGKPFVRWAFCKQPHVLQEALDRLGKAFA